MIVIDASVACKLILPLEASHYEVKEIFRKHVQALEEIIVPDFLFYEVANTLATKSAITSNKVTKSLTTVYQATLNIHHCTEYEVKEAARLAKKYKTSVYDMLYAVLAKSQGVILITADEQFVRQTNFKFVKLLI